MARLEFLKRITYKSKIAGLEDMKVTLLDPGNEDEFFNGVKESEDLVEKIKEDRKNIKKFRKAVLFANSFVEKIENLEIKFNDKYQKVDDLKPLSELKGLQLMSIVPIIAEIMQNVQQFGNIIKKNNRLRRDFL